MPSLRIRAFAKINLRLDVLGRRSDGYHELRTVFQSLSLHDTLELELRSRPGITLECHHSLLPTGPRNLVWRALDCLRRELGLRAGVHARLTKRIPVARGLGGGSSDAAAALLGLLRLSRRELPAPRLRALAASLGADVPYFLVGGRALGVDRGDRVYPLPDLAPRAVLVISPRGIGVNTREAYRWLDSRLTSRPAPPTLFDLCALCWSPQGAGVANAFEAPVFRRHPRLAQLKRELLRRGAAEAALAGSGSAVFGLFQDPAQARRAARWFSNDQVFVARTISRVEYCRAGGGRWPAQGNALD